MNGKARILFVDDEKRVLNAMRGLFRRDYELFLASGGAEAIRMAAENDVDVIVADQRMPGMTGIEVLAKMKEQSPRTVRILLTGYADPSAVEGSINLGEVFRFLSKPCPPQVLRETLTLAISAARTKPVAPTVPPPSAEPLTPAAPPPSTEPRIQREPVVAEQAPAQDTIRDFDETHPALQTLDEADVIPTSEKSSSHWQSVTNVVMSEDSVEETQENVALTAAAMGFNEIGVVVFTIDPEFATSAMRAVPRERSTVLATRLINVAQAIEEQGAGVLVTDFTTNGTILQKIIGTLKKYLPELVTIVVSSGRDTTDMINLINYGQVFRYVMKPVDPKQLREDIDAAVMRHLYLLNNPESAKRHQVVEPPVTGDSSKSLNQFLGRVRQLQAGRTDPTDTIS